MGFHHEHTSPQTSPAGSSRDGSRACISPGALMLAGIGQPKGQRGRPGGAFALQPVRVHQPHSLAGEGSGEAGGRPWTLPWGPRALGS